MRLISCHIENFGKLHDYSVDFNKGLNVIRQNNGWGKSTFVAFIRVMFYGLEGARKRDISDNERKRYNPWQGGVYGGRLVFEVDGKCYTITRIFKEKENEDEFELRDTLKNTLSNDYSCNIGKELFRIDRESFMRTVFIDQNDSHTEQTDDINAKIGNLTDNTNDINSFESASKNLTDMINHMSPRRTTGSLHKLNERIMSLDKEVKDGASISDNIEQTQLLLDAKHNELLVLGNDKKCIQEQIRKTTALQEIIAKKDEWIRLKEKSAQKKSEYLESTAYFPGDIPHVEDIKCQQEKYSKFKGYQDRYENFFITEEEDRVYSSLRAKYETKMPTDEEINALLRLASEYRERKLIVAKEQLSENESDRLVRLEQDFSEDTQPVSNMVGKWNERNVKNNAVNSNETTLNVLKGTLSSQRKKTISPIVLAGIVAVVIGIVVAIGVNPIIGIALAVVGIILAVAGLVATKSKGLQQSPELVELEQKIEDDRNSIIKIDTEIKEYLTRHGRAFEESLVGLMLQEINGEYLEYKNLKAKKEKADANDDSDLKTMAENISRVLIQCGFVVSDTEFLEKLHVLKDECNQFVALSEKKKIFDEASRNKAVLQIEIHEFLKKYGFQPKENLSAQLDEMRDMAGVCANAKLAYDEAQSELKVFEQRIDTKKLENNLDQTEVQDLSILHEREEAISDKQEECRKTIIDYNKRIELLQENYDKVEDSRIMLEDLRAVHEAEKKKFNYLSMVQEKLVDAKEAITSKYTRPILESYSKYYEMISGESADRFHIDANSNITIEECGKQREIATQSFGYRDMISVCLRIAFADAMYQNEKPMIVMDDPFTNLDDVKVADAKLFLDKLSKEYQVIYLTCSDSRA